MFRRQRPELSYANVAATLAVCVALTSPAWGDPVADSAASLGKNVKKALKLGKQADKRSKKALTAAKKAEQTAAEALAQGGPRGLQGPPGPGGAAGSARAYGLVAPNGTLDSNVRKGVDSITKTAEAGRYCIKLAAGIDSSPVEPLAVADYNTDDTPIGLGANSNDLTIVQIDSAALDCPSGQLEVVTGLQNFTNGQLEGNVSTDQGFFFVVP